MKKEGAQPRKWSGYFFRIKLAPWALLALPVLFTVWLKYYPIYRAFYLSLFQYDPINPPGKFIGFENFSRMFQTKYYYDAWINTFIYLALQLVMCFFIPVIQALFLNELRRFQRSFTTMYILPALVPASINVIVWKWIWNPDYGVANQLVKLFGGMPQGWLSDTNWTLFCIVFPAVIGGGISVLLYLSAIQGISSDILESAALDGCTGWQRIWHMVLPNIRYVVFIQFILAVIATMQILDTPYMYAAGGPSGASTTMGIYIYNTFQQDFNYGRGSAASVVLFLVIAVMTFVQMKLDRSETE